MCLVRLCLLKKVLPHKSHLTDFLLPFPDFDGVCFDALNSISLSTYCFSMHCFCVSVTTISIFLFCQYLSFQQPPRPAMNMTVNHIFQLFFNIALPL